MYTQAVSIVTKCDACQRVGCQPKEQAKGAIPSAGAHELWHLDFMGPLKGTEQDCRYIILAVDQLTRIARGRAVKSTDAQTVIAFVREEIIFGFGLPEQIVTDRGSGFASHEFQRFCDQAGINHTMTAAYNPGCNGMVERKNGQLAQVLIKLCIARKCKWQDVLNTALYTLNSTYNRMIGCSPLELSIGKKPKILVKINDSIVPTCSDQSNLFIRVKELKLLDSMRELLAAKRDDKQDEKLLAWNSSRSSESSIKPGEQVLRYNPKRATEDKLQSPWQGPYTVLQVYPNGNVKLQIPPPEKFHPIVNGNQVKRYHSDPTDAN